MHISIALATFNGEKYIAEQLDSIAAQTLLPAELVVCDDCSTDKTIDFVARFAANSPFPVQIFRNEVNRGYRNNFMQAASRCSGDFVAFSDQDDVWVPNKLEAVAGGFTGDKVLLVYHNATVTDDVLRPIGDLDRFGMQSPDIDFFGFPSPWFSSLGFTMVFRRELLAYGGLHQCSIDHNNPCEALAHDQWFFFWAGVAGRIAYIPEKLALYRQHDSNVDGWGGGRHFFSRAAGLSNHFDGYQSYYRASRNRSDLLERASLEWPGLAAKFRRGSAAYERLAELYLARAKLYEEPGIAGRLALWLRLLREASYRSDKATGSWGLGKKACFQDFVFGIPFGPNLAGRLGA